VYDAGDPEPAIPHPEQNRQTLTGIVDRVRSHQVQESISVQIGRCNPSQFEARCRG
jgi:hypothetical protein